MAEKTMKERADRQWWNGRIYSGGMGGRQWRNDSGGMRGKTVEEWEKIQWQSRREDSGGIMGGRHWRNGKGNGQNKTGIYD